MDSDDYNAKSSAPRTTLTDSFATLTDPRREHGRCHLLDDILVLTICAVICGADNFVAVEAFGYAKQAWLRHWRCQVVGRAR